jgi:hypothetical protein
MMMHGLANVKPFTVVDGEWQYVLDGTVLFCFMKHGPVN